MWVHAKKLTNQEILEFVPANICEINRISGFLCNLIELVNLIRYPATFSVCQVLFKSHQEARARGMSFVLKVKVMELILKSMLSKILVQGKDPKSIRSKDFWILEIFFSYRVFVLLVSINWFLPVGVERNWYPQQNCKYILGETSVFQLQRA